MDEKNDIHKDQKKYLSTQKQLRVWVKPDKYEQFKQKVDDSGTSIYAVINAFIDDYIQSDD